MSAATLSGFDNIHTTNLKLLGFYSPYFNKRWTSLAAIANILGVFTCRSIYDCSSRSVESREIV